MSTDAKHLALKTSLLWMTVESYEYEVLSLERQYIRRREAIYNRLWWWETLYSSVEDTYAWDLATIKKEYMYDCLSARTRFINSLKNIEAL